MTFTGAITALITPLKNGAVDTKKLEELVEFQITEGIDGLVPCGTTGEACTLSMEEQSTVIRTVTKQAKGRVVTIAGAGANNTAAAIANSKMATEAGADALLHVTPYYNRPPQEGLVAHFRAIAEATSLPIVIYNVPARTNCDMLPATVVEISKIKNIVGIKEATGSVARGQQVIAACAEDFVVLSGDDRITFALIAAGGHGVISVISNITPKAMATMIALIREGKIDEARLIQQRLLPLMELLSVKVNPIPIKAAMSMMGYTENELRLPLVPLTGDPLSKLQSEMKRQRLI